MVADPIVSSDVPLMNKITILFLTAKESGLLRLEDVRHTVGSDLSLCCLGY